MQLYFHFSTLDAEMFAIILTGIPSVPMGVKGAYELQVQRVYGLASR